MKINIFKGTLLIAALASLASCSQSELPDGIDTDNGRRTMNFHFSMPGASRVADDAFETGDKVGLFVAETDKPLEIAGNVVNNEPLTFDGNAWNATRKLYWNDGTFNAYAYYPFAGEISSVSSMPFSVQTDQSIETDGMSGFEASDFLWSAARNITASNTPVEMTFRHIMSRITIQLVKGEDYEGELPDDAAIYIHNTVPTATVDLSAGVATPLPKGARQTIKASQSGRHTYTAIVVPQRLPNRVPLIEIETKGVSMLYETKFLFKPGIHHHFNVILDKDPEQIKIEIGGEIVNWN